MDTCGFCGLSGSCHSFLRSKSKRGPPIVGSTCTYAPRSSKCEKANDVDLSVSIKRKFTTRNPCTNLPMKCELCSDSVNYVWKYHMPRHIALVHDGPRGSQRGGSETFKDLYRVEEAEIKAVTGVASGGRGNKRRRVPAAAAAAAASATNVPAAARAAVAAAVAAGRVQGRGVNRAT